MVSEQKTLAFCITNNVGISSFVYSSVSVYNTLINPFGALKETSKYGWSLMVVLYLLSWAFQFDLKYFK